MTLTPAPAEAATKGSGVPGLTPYGGYLGNYVASDGTRVYCVDSSLPWPSGPMSEASLVTGLTTTWGTQLPDETLRKLNYVLLTWGQTGDAWTAAAVAAYVNAYTSGWAHDIGPGYAAGAWYLNGNAQITAVYDFIWRDAESRVEPVDYATVQIEMHDATTGTVAVAATDPTAAGTLVLEGAVDAASGESQVAVSAEQRVEIRGVPGDTDLEYYIAAEVSYESPVVDASLRLYTTPGQQRTISAGGPSVAAFGAAARTDAITVGPRPGAPVVAPAVPPSLPPTLAPTGSTTDGVMVGGAGLLLIGALLGISARSRRWV